MTRLQSSGVALKCSTYSHRMANFPSFRSASNYDDATITGHCTVVEEKTRLDANERARFVGGNTVGYATKRLRCNRRFTAVTAHYIAQSLSQYSMLQYYGIKYCPNWYEQIAMEQSLTCAPSCYRVPNSSEISVLSISNIDVFVRRECIAPRKRSASLNVPDAILGVIDRGGRKRKVGH